MSIFNYSQIYLNKSYKEFAGIQKSLKNAYFIIVGMPYDSTTTYRPGARFATTAIREASLNIETNSILAKAFLEDVAFYDAGDLDIVALEVKEALRRITFLSEDVSNAKKVLVAIGGEHTITYGIAKGIKFDTIVIFDAHFDLRDEYPVGVRYGHATVVRRIYEDIRPPKMMLIGTRAFSKEEMEFVKDKEIKYIPSELIKEDLNSSIEKVRTFIKDSSKIYLSIDMDVLDPSVCPGVSNPEYYGLTLYEFFKLLKPILSRKIVGLDLVEVCPPYDNGITSLLASKILLECISTIWFSQP